MADTATTGMMAGPGDRDQKAHRTRRRRRGLSAVLAAAMTATGVIALAAPQAAAATITVTTTADSPAAGECSLREAFVAANTDSGVGGCAAGSAGDMITFAPGVSGVIQLGSTLPALTSNVTIAGPGADVLTIRGDRGPSPSVVRNLEIAAAAAVTIRDVTIERIDGDLGGAIGNLGTLTLERVVLSDNAALGITASNSLGGGVANKGVLTIRSSTIVGNEASFGGGLSNEGTLTVVNSTVADNDGSFGGGLFNGGTATLTHVTLTGNRASLNDGGISPLPVATTAVSGSIIGGNSTTLGDRPNCGLGITNGGNNLSFGGGCGPIGDDDPLLGSLDDNGGSTPTMLPAPGSPALDAISLSGGACATSVTSDQRGVARPQGDGCDIGAVEVADAAAPDELAPEITITSPASGATYLLGATVVADYGCVDEDDGSGVATCGGDLPAGDRIDTSAVGPKTFSVTATDVAGNSDTKSVDFQVAYGFSGFASPVDPGAVNVAKAGRTIPLKFTVTDALGNSVSTLTAVTASAVRYPCEAGVQTDPLEEYAAGKSGLQNLGNGDYQFNLQSSKTWTACWTLGIDLGDGIQRTATFQFR